MLHARRWPEWDRQQRCEQGRNEHATWDEQRGGNTAAVSGVPGPDLGDSQERDETARHLLLLDGPQHRVSGAYGTVPRRGNLECRLDGTTRGTCSVAWARPLV